MADTEVEDVMAAPADSDVVETVVVGPAEFAQAAGSNVAVGVAVAEIVDTDFAGRVEKIHSTGSAALAEGIDSAGPATSAVNTGSAGPLDSVEYTDLAGPESFPVRSD